MVNVDELNEEIKQFGIVVEKMKELPEIYEKIQVQLEVCRSAANELQMIKEDMGKFMTMTTQTIESNQKSTEANLNSVENNLEQKLDKAEVGLRDRVALTESNLNLALNNLTHAFENSMTELNRRLDADANENKKRYIIVVIGVCIAIILGLVSLFI